MLSRSPTIGPGSRTIRTHLDDFDTETEPSDVDLAESNSDDENDHLSIAQRLVQNEAFMDLQLAHPSTWQVKRRDESLPDGTPVIIIQKPTASHMSHRLLNPYIYRIIKDVGTLSQLADILNTPSDWETHYNNVVQDGRIVEMMRKFRALPDNTAESRIQAQFITIVSTIADRLGVNLESDSETKIIVGGILARYQYDLRSKTDPHFAKDGGINLLATEIKTHLTFPEGEMWYHGSRGVQLLSALYSFNCPTMLLTQKQWKLFVENSTRNSILTFPYDNDADLSSHANSSLVNQIGATFLKVIMICLLSERGSIGITESRLIANVTETPPNKQTKTKYFGTVDKEPTRKSRRLMKDGDGEIGPSFISGYNTDGYPIYQEIRIRSEEDVGRIEQEISEQERFLQ